MTAILKLLYRAGGGRTAVVRDDQASFEDIRASARLARSQGGRFSLVDTGKNETAELEWLCEAGADLFHFRRRPARRLRPETDREGLRTGRFTGGTAYRQAARRRLLRSRLCGFPGAPRRRLQPSRVQQGTSAGFCPAHGAGLWRRERPRIARLLPSRRPGFGTGSACGRGCADPSFGQGTRRERRGPAPGDRGAFARLRPEPFPLPGEGNVVSPSSGTFGKRERSFFSRRRRATRARPCGSSKTRPGNRRLPPGTYYLDTTFLL